MASVFLPHQSQPQSNREYIFDDPLEPLRLPPLAQISGFWRRYDRLADIHDKKLTTNLNGNLDVLLIFAALFSAINTTFISITMPELSPNPSDETNILLRLLVMRADNNTLTPSDLAPPFSANSNSITVNCLLYASLSCSLLAAVGAMMAKEWLQSFDRTGQTGPLEEQALFRQRKFNGVQQWHLEAVIKFLPNLLLLSVIFFFVGICLFLFPINTVVAGIVIAFSGIGLVSSGIVIVAGAVSPTCPYQSAASSALRRGGRGLALSWMLVWRALVRPALSRTAVGVRKSRAYIRVRIGSLMGGVNLAVGRFRFWHHRPASSGDSVGQQNVGQDSGPSTQALSDPDGSISVHAIETPSFDSTESEQAEDRDRYSSVQGHPVAGYVPTGVFRAIPRVKRLWENLPTLGFFPALHNGSAVPQLKPSSGQVLTIQAARWLLETTSNRGDQISTAQFICSLDRTICRDIFEDHDSWRRLCNLALGAFEIWYSQPTRENQEVAELFGLVLCRILAQCPKEDYKRKDVTENPSQTSSNFGKVFLQTLTLTLNTYTSEDHTDDQRCLHISVLFAALKENINLKQFQWVNLSCLLSRDSPIAAALVTVWARFVMRRGYIESGTTLVAFSTTIVDLWESR
ncbi:hypothetical protein FRC01_007005 [Tulasnella sp. 417]|nr:hypothetical protein FRC01_007005 [Tulasnella sp. 417]